MPGSPISVKLRCQSWQQLAAIHSRDLSRNAFFLKTSTPPALGRAVRISLTLPSGSTVELVGKIDRHIKPKELDGRGPGIDVALGEVPASTLWLLESALKSAGLEPGTEIPITPINPTAIPGDPNIESGDKWIAAERDLIKALWGELTSMPKLNPFQLLQVSYDADTQQVRTAFGELSKKYHPDRFARFESFEIRELSSEVFILVRDAYRLISTSTGRSKVLAGLDLSQSVAAVKAPSATSPQSPPPVPMSVPHAPLPSVATPASEPVAPARSSPATGTPPPSLEENPDKLAVGLSLIEAGNYDSARKVLTLASRRDRSDNQLKGALELVEGLLALASGDRMEAGQRFEVALDLDPANERAAREIAEMRRFSTGQRRGLLSKLMEKD